MSAKEITGISLSALGLIGVIYSAIGLFDSSMIYRNPLVGIVFVAMIFLLVGIILVNRSFADAEESNA